MEKGFLLLTTEKFKFIDIKDFLGNDMSYDNWCKFLGCMVDATFRSPFFKNLEKIGDAYEMEEKNRKVDITQCHKCGIVTYQLAKLYLLEFHYDILDKNVDQRDFKYVYFDTTSAYFSIIGDLRSALTCFGYLVFVSEAILY